MNIEIIYKSLNWIFRSFSVVMLILLLMFIFGEGLPQIGEKSPRELILLITLFILAIGMILIWWSERPGAYTILGSSVVFWLINSIYSSRFWFHWLFLIFLIVGGGILYTNLKLKGKSKRR